MKLAALSLPLLSGISRLSSRARIFGWAVLLSLMFGALSLGEPVDLLLQRMRDLVRSHASDGAVVVVRIDNKAVRGLKTWPQQRAIDAKTIDTLFELGARRVIYDRLFADVSPVGDDVVLAAALKRHPGRIYLATRFDEDGSSGQRDAILPIPSLRPHARLGSIVIWRNFLGYTTGVPFQTRIGEKLYPSFSSILSDRYIASRENFRPDYSIDHRTVPSVSLADVLDRSPEAAIVSGKDVIIGVTAPSLGDLHTIPGQGSAPGVFVHVIGAETLRHAIPMRLNWVTFYLAAFALAAIYSSLNKKRWVGQLVEAASAVLIVLVPVILDAWNIETAISPAALLLIVVIVRGKILSRRINNPITGLPKLDQITEGAPKFAGTLVGVKIKNLADLRSMLSTSEEARLFDEIVRRVRVGNPDLDVLQGDDCLIWKTEMAASGKLLDHLEALHAMMALPFDLGLRRVDLSVAFGIDDDADRELVNRVGSVLVSADEALATGSRWKVHDARRLEDADFRLSLLGRMESALENGEIWVAYQPKLDLKAKRLSGAEALVRWTHPERGFIPPDRFIPEAEAANRIAGLTAFVLDTAIRDTASLDAVDPSFSVAVNLSVRLLGTSGFVDSVAACLDRHGLDPSRLTLEVTESAEIDFSGTALATLCALRDLGVKLSIDDYGTKYSTLDYVRQLPASEIKIDQRFIRSMHMDESARIMAKSTIEMAHSLGLTVVAEGVELPATMAALTDMGCDVLQGYLIGKPIRFEAMRRFLSNTLLRYAA